MYGLLLEVDLQLKEIQKHCLGDCGKAYVGGLCDKQLGFLMLCDEKKCPYLYKEMDIPIGEFSGKQLFLRKLKEEGIDEGVRIRLDE